MSEPYLAARTLQWLVPMRHAICLGASMLFIASLAVTASCASTPGAKPHDMGAAQHEAMAKREEQAAQLHAAQYNPGASASSERCSGAGARPGFDGACWSSTRNPTAEHLEEARKHRQIAAEHRAASQALRDAEARACVGIPDEDRDESPFSHREDIASVEPLMGGSTSGKSPSARLIGAVVAFRAVPGMTAQWLQRVVDCHLARNAVLGHDVPEMAYCPLVPKDVTAKVTATDAGFAVAIRSDDSGTAQEVLRRARALVTR